MDECTQHTELLQIRGVMASFAENVPAPSGKLKKQRQPLWQPITCHYVYRGDG